MLKQQMQALMHDNGILKRGIQIQHERQKEFDDKSQEVQQLKQLLPQYQEQLRRLEVGRSISLFQSIRFCQCFFKTIIQNFCANNLCFSFAYRLLITH